MTAGKLVSRHALLRELDDPENRRPAGLDNFDDGTYVPFYHGTTFRWMDLEPRETHWEGGAWLPWFNQHGIPPESVLIHSSSDGIIGFVARDIEARRVYWIALTPGPPRIELRYVQLESPPLPFPTPPSLTTTRNTFARRRRG